MVAINKFMLTNTRNKRVIITFPYQFLVISLFSFILTNSLTNNDLNIVNPIIKSEAETLININGALQIELPIKDEIHITIDGGKFITFPQSNGKFSFKNLPTGNHILKIFHSELVFPTYLIEISNSNIDFEFDLNNENSEPIISAYIQDPLLGKTKKVALPLLINSINSWKLVSKKPKFPFLSFFKSPMILIGLVFLLLTQFMPYLQKMSEPDTQSQETQNTGTKIESDFISKIK